MDFDYKKIMGIGTVILGFVLIAGAIYFVVTIFAGVGSKMVQATGTANNTAVINAQQTMTTTTQNSGNWLSLGVIIGIAGIFLSAFGLNELFSKLSAGL